MTTPACDAATDGRRLGAATEHAKLVVEHAKLTVDLDVKLSRDRQANRATKTNMCMRLREYHSEEYTPLPDSTTVADPTSSSIA